VTKQGRERRIKTLKESGGREREEEGGGAFDFKEKENPGEKNAGIRPAVSRKIRYLNMEKKT